MDTRIVYGARCSWWDSISEVMTTPSGLPVCPHCGSPLFEIPTEEEWWVGAREFETKGNPGYVEFVEWLRGRCYPSLPAARRVYDAEKGS